MAAFLNPVPFFRATAPHQKSRLSPVRRAVVVAKSDGGRRNLELNWKFQNPENRRPVTCPACSGSGKCECQWCHATGLLMLGDALICSIDGQTKCFNCTDGEVKCQKCKGHGILAAWLV